MFESRYGRFFFSFFFMMMVERRAAAQTSAKRERRRAAMSEANVGASVYINPKGKFILSPQEQHQSPRFKVSSKGLSPAINILIRSPIQVLTEAAVA